VAVQAFYVCGGLTMPKEKESAMMPIL